MIKRYKSGRVRVTGADMAWLRFECWKRDGGRCQECGKSTFWSERFAGDPEAYHMAHIKSRGAGGSDELSNLRTLCASDHRAEHGGTLKRKGPYREVSA